MLDSRPVHHIALVVQDLQRAEGFYVGLLGLHVTRRWHDSQGAPRSVWLALGRDGLLMLERGDARPPTGGGWHLLAWRIHAEERAALESQLAAKGVPIINRSAYTLYIEDPEGNRIGLSHWPDPAS
ncbi:MAG TPA: VOC family protein [Myxococcota bacterium]|nr:VOC family protein [Myxococcota bacterium]